MNKTLQQLNDWQISSAIDLKGYGTKYDPTVMKQFSPTGQNVFIENGVLSPRFGSEPFGTDNNVNIPGKSEWTFNVKGPFPKSIMMRAYGTVVEYYHPTLKDWFLLKDGFTAGQRFGRAEQNNAPLTVTGITTGYIYFCNAMESMCRWNGSIATILSTDATTITTNELDLGALGFLSSGHIDVNGISYGYGSIGYSYDQIQSVSNEAKPFAQLAPNNNLIAQSFIPTQTNLNSITIQKKASSGSFTGNVIIHLRGDNTGVPLFSDLTAITISNADWQAIANDTDYVVSLQQTLTPGTKYWIVFDADTNDNANYPNLSANSSGGYASGNLYIYNTTWNATTESIYFKTNYARNKFVVGVPVTATANTPVNQSAEFNETIPNGNVLMVDNMTLYVAGVTTNANTVYRSKITDATNWTISATRLSGEAFFADVSEYGGRIIGFIKDEKVIYVVKDTIIKTLEYLATSDALTNDSPIFKNLKAYDGKSQNTGGITGGAIFSNGNGIFFVNNRNEINQLDRLEYIDYPQIVPISDLIKVTAQQGVFDEAVGIIYQQRAYIAYKQTTSSQQNDAVLVYDIVEKRWEEPIIGWFVNDFTIYNNELHWISSIINTSYHSLNTKTDNALGFTAIWRSWQEDFGIPALQKNCGGLFVEGYISDQVLYNKDLDDGGLLVSILFDENGATSAIEKTISADTPGIIFSPAKYNPFGANAFGFERFGSNVDISGLKKFRCIIPIKDNIEFYTIQVQFSSNGIAYDWQIVRWGWLITNVCAENSKIQI